MVQAKAGYYELDIGLKAKCLDLVLLDYDHEAHIYPEVAINRQFLSVRFFYDSRHGYKPEQVKEMVDFSLAY
jgi:cell division FtsZ-interacting protein ZapD